MLDERITEKLVERLVNRIEKGNTYVLEQIGKSIKKIGTLSPSKAQQLINVLKYGGNYEKIVNELARITELNVKDIYKIFEEIAKNDYRFAKQFYDYRGVKYIPYEENYALQSQVRALASMTANEYRNLSNTLAFAKKVNGRTIYTNLSRTYQDTIDKAVLNVSQGKTTFDEEMYSTIKELASSGLRTVDYANNRSIRIDSAVRMNMQGALRNLHNEMQRQFGQEFGADGVEISVHNNPAPDHTEAQGRQFSYEEFAKLQSIGVAKDYTGKIINMHHELVRTEASSLSFRPISDYNCKHYEFDIVLGVSKPEYSEEELQEIIDNNNRGFELDGKHYTNYEGTQLQRKLELEIRKAKDTQIMAKASGNNQLVLESQQRITQLTNKYKELSDVSGLPTKMDRLRVSGYKRTKVNSTSNISPLEKLQNYQSIIDKNGVNSLNYNEIFNDYTQFYNNLDKNEVNNIINKMNDYNKRYNVKTSNPMGEFINEKLGYDVKPELITQKEFMIGETGEEEFDYILLDENHLYRGIKDYDLEKTKDDIEEFKIGKFYAGSGIEGNGTYFTNSYSTAVEYAFNKKDDFVIKAILKNNAKTINFEDIDEIKRNLYKYGMNISDKKFKEFSSYILTDNGYIASLLGYDVIKGQNIIILNRKSIKVVK